MDAMQAEFFNSVNNLCSLYHIALPDVSELKYPKNIAAAYEQVRQQLESKKVECDIGRDYKRKACIAVTKTFNTGHTLYYIPVRPLCRMLKDSHDDPMANLILWLFRYLYQITSIPYFREGCYLSSNYEMLQEWLSEDLDMEEDYQRRQQQDLEELETEGDNLLLLLRQPFNIRALKTAISRCACSEDAGSPVIKIATEFLHFAKKYRYQSLARRTYKNYSSEDEDIVQLDQYVSFYWSGEDSLYETLIETVNTGLQEMGTIAETKSVQWFDKPQQQESHDFSYEQTLFDLIDRLTEQLNNLDYEEHQQGI